MTRIQISLIVALTLTLGTSLYIVWLKADRDALRAETTRLGTDLSAAQAQLDALTLNAVLNGAALIEREKAVEELARTVDQLDAQLREIYETDCAAAAWADTVMPDDVFSRLRQAAPGIPAPSKADASGGAAAERPGAPP